MIDINIKDGSGQGNTVKVTDTGELVTVRGNYDTPKKLSLTSTGTAYNFFGPNGKKNFIITGLIINADKNVTSSAVVDIYEATDATSTTIDEPIMTLDITKLTTQVITGVLIKTNFGKFINAKTDDATINLTILGYYLGD